MEQTIEVERELGIVPSGTLEVKKNGTYDVTNKATAEVAVEIPTAEMDISEDGTYDVTEYGTAKVKVNSEEKPLELTENNTSFDTTHYSQVKTNIPDPTDEIDITEDGEHNVAKYGVAKVSVNNETQPLQITEDGTADTTHHSSVVVKVNSEEEPLEIRNDGTADTTHHSSVNVNVNYEESPLEITENNVTVNAEHYSQVSVAVKGASQVTDVTITNKSDFENLQFQGTYLTIPLAVSVLPATAPQMTQVVVSDKKMVRVLDNGDGTHSLHILRGGTCTVTVYDYAGAISDSFDIVINQALEDISFPYTSLNITENGTRQLAVQFKPSTATNQDIVWSSSHEDITVDQNGLVTANGTGHATISAYSAELDKTITCGIEVAAYPETADFADVKAHPENYGAGSLLPDKLTYNNKEYDFNWRVADADYPVTLPDGTQARATILFADHSLPFNGAYSTEALITCKSGEEPTALADTYYYGKSGSSYVALDTQVGDPLPYSDYDLIYKTGLHYTKSLSTIGQGYINRWDGSTIRAILNSDADNVKSAYQPVHITDVVNYTGKGFLQMINPALLEVVGAIKNTTTDNNACFDADNFTTDDLFWLPAARQLNFSPSTYSSDKRPAAREDDEGVPFQYYVNEIGAANNNAAECRKMPIMGQTSTNYYWLRSARFTYSGGVLNGNSSGALTNNNAYNNSYFAPACAIIH